MDCWSRKPVAVLSSRTNSVEAFIAAGVDARGRGLKETARVHTTQTDRQDRGNGKHGSHSRNWRRLSVFDFDRRQSKRWQLAADDHYNRCDPTTEPARLTAADLRR